MKFLLIANHGHGGAIDVHGTDVGMNEEMDLFLPQSRGGGKTGGGPRAGDGFQGLQALCPPLSTQV